MIVSLNEYKYNRWFLLDYQFGLQRFSFISQKYEYINGQKLGLVIIKGGKQWQEIESFFTADFIRY